MGTHRRLWMGVLPALLGIIMLLASCPVGVVATGLPDAPDLDPAFLSLVTALLHAPDVPSPGALRSVSMDGRTVSLRFAGLVVVLPAGQVENATVPLLAQTLLERQSSVTLLQGSTITYGMLAADAPRTTTAPMPPLLNADGSLSSLPAGAVPVALITSEMRVIGGLHVPLRFSGMVAPDAPPAPLTPRTREAFAKYATDLLRAGMPLREPVWIRTVAGYRLIQPFTRRVLVWDPATDAVGDTDLGEVALVSRLISDDGVGGAVLAAITLRMTDVDAGIGVAVAYATPRGDFGASWDGATLYPSASVMKLAILAACEDAIARGDLRRDEEIDALEEEMIVYSSNEAANDLIDIVGRTRINDLMRRIGMAHSYLGSHFDTATFDDDDDNYLAPRESVLLMTALVHGEVGDAGRIRDLLSRSQAPGSIRTAFTDDNLPVTLYEKRGWYDGVENDVVRIEFGHGAALTIAIFQPDVGDIEAAWLLFTDLTRIGMGAVASSR